MSAPSPHRILRAAALAVALMVASPASHAASGEPGKLTVGVTGKYPPFNYFSPDGELVGFDVDIAKEICRLLKVECVFSVMQWDGIVNAVTAGKLDIVVGSMAITEERARAVRFSIPYYESGAQLFVTDPGAVPEDMAGVRIGLTLGTTYGPYARKHFPQADLRYYKGDVEVLQDIQKGRLDGILTDKLVGFFMKRQYGVDIEPYGDLLFTEQMAIPVHPDRLELLGQLNGAISQIRQSAFYQGLFDKYFGEGAAPGAGEYAWGNMMLLMLQALGQTIAIAGLGLVLGLLAAGLLAFLMLAPPKPVARIVSFWVDFIRATPFLVQLFILYFGLPTIGIELSAWTAAVAGIALHSSAYLGEMVKVAYRAVPVGQHHAARTLGLTPRESLRHVIVPQMLPGLTVPVLNTVVAMIKDSAIVSVISVHELTMQTQQLIAATFKPMELYLIAAAMYFVVTYPLLIAGRRLEKRFEARGLLHG